jgi:hypothetical protein
VFYLHLFAVQPAAWNPEDRLSGLVQVQTRCRCIRNVAGKKKGILCDGSEQLTMCSPCDPHKNSLRLYISLPILQDEDYYLIMPCQKMSSYEVEELEFLDYKIF